MSDEITEGESREFRMEGGDIIRADGTCAGYTALDFQSWFRRLEALAGLAGEMRTMLHGAANAEERDMSDERTRQDGPAQWVVDVGDEGLYLQSPDERCWGMNKNYSHPEKLIAYLNRLEALAGLAGEMRAAIEPLGEDAAFTPADSKWWVRWCQAYDHALMQDETPR